MIDITGGRWYRDLVTPVPLTPIGCCVIEVILRREMYETLREIEREPDQNSGTAMVEWESCVGPEIAVFEWEAS